MMEGALLTERQVTFALLISCWPGCTDGFKKNWEREKKKKDRCHWSREEINRVTSLHSWGLVEGFLLLKAVSCERWRTHHSMKSELQLCSVNLLGCFPLPWLCSVWGLMGKHHFDVFLNFSVEHIRHEAYQIQVQSIWAKFTVGIDDFLQCFRWHSKQVFNVLISIEPRLFDWEQ